MQIERALATIAKASKGQKPKKINKGLCNNIQSDLLIRL